MSENFNKGRIVKNTILLYARMLFTVWLNLYATRLVLDNLGIEDMGVYGVVGSIVSIFTVFTSGITNAVQRFITFELGRKEGDTNKVFCSSLNVIFLMAAALLVLLEVGGLWVLNHKINIPPESTESAFWVFQLSVLTCIVNLISIPYNALVIAHEKMDAFAGISILQVVLTCAAAYCLSLFPDNRLLWYAILMAVISVLVRILYQVYCHIKFEEAHYHFDLDRNILKGIGKFAGVSTISGVLQMVTTQGLVFVINWTFGVAINAVYTIALQLKNSILSFALNINKAVSPQITKTYASGEEEAHKKLVYGGSKLEVFLIYFIMIPFLFRTEYIMELWLGEVPSYAIEFAQCIVFISLTYAAFEPIRTAVLATNKITKFSIVPETFNIAVLPVGYIVSHLTNNPFFLIIVIVGFDILTCAIRVYYAGKVSLIKLRALFYQIILPCAIVAILSGFVCWGISSILSSDLKGLMILLVVHSVILAGIIYEVGLSKHERGMIRTFVNRMIKK